MISLSVEELTDYRKYICDTSSLYFSCILKGEAKGILWADRADSPNFLLVWSYYQEGFQLMGQPVRGEEETFKDWFYQTILPFLKEQEVDYFEYGADTKELADWFGNMFSDKEIFSENQKIFQWTEKKETLQQPAGYLIEKVDADFWQKEYQDKAYMLDEIKQVYNDSQTYLENGIAYVAIQDNTVVARADMLFSDNGYGNISVDTKEAHRRKGLSAYLTQKTIADTCKMGLIPVWDCSEDNLASERTAEKCGFRMIREEVISGFGLEIKN